MKRWMHFSRWLTGLFSCMPLIVQAGSTIWNGPEEGPPRQPGMHIIYLADTMQNGGISGVYRGLQQASQCLGWKLSYLDSNSVHEKLISQFNQAVAEHADAIVLGGINSDAIKPAIQAAKSVGIIIAGWHAQARAGASDDLVTNITTEADQVATMAAQFIIEHSSGEVGVVILNDARFDIANAKTAKMQEVINSCSRCSVLSVENVPITESDARMRDLVPHLNQQFGSRWTHTLAINDIYFDHINYPLRTINRLDIRNVSAGDGSAKAISRIISGRSQQVATIAEPLNQQGWQLADELNRAFAKSPASGYIAPPILITTGSTLQKDTAAGEAESNIFYKQYYRKIWGCTPSSP